MNQSRDNRSRRVRRGGFTMVELLVAMAVTLILIFALAQAFAVVGESVAKGRATIEMAGNLRMVANRLQRDLQGVTVPVRSGAEVGAGGGYFEALDGSSTDKDWNSDGTYDINPTTSDTTYGDVDDVLAFTTRNAGDPFFGTAYERGNGTPPLSTWDTFQSTLAEVVWWIQYQDLDNDGVRDTVANGDAIDEPYMIHRRAMMIRPDMIDLPIRQLAGATVAPGASPGVYRVFTFGDGLVITRYNDGRMVAAYPNTGGGHALLRNDLFNFYNNNDVSVRLIWQAPPTSSVVNVRLACNSLADLTKRESRFAHVKILFDRPGLALASTPSVGQFPFPMDTNRNSVTSLCRSTKFGENLGEDVMVHNALAFDVQVFDSDVPLLNSTAGDALVPSDPGYPFPNARPTTLPTSVPRAIGFGAFVDIGYVYRRNTSADFNPNSANRWPVFANRPSLKSQLNVYDYCTWSSHYENNGVNEDGDTLTDEGTNGFDDETSLGSGNYVDGVDDVGERETLPPYPVSLRGIQIRIRTWDPDSRQVRQVTVVSDFVPE